MENFEKILQMDFESGELFLLNKAQNWTSFDVVNKVRYAVKRYMLKKRFKVGHAGTLDPLATGLLLIAVGRMTKRIEEFQGHEKEYCGSIFLGATTETYDSEMEPNQFFDVSHITEDMICEKVLTFTGEIWQLPPIYSALKVEGKRLYKSARKGLAVKSRPRNVMVHSFEITKIEMPLVHFKVVCSKGTYIRSLANDLGEALGAGAYLASLQRTRIGDFLLEDAWEPQDLTDAIYQARDLRKAAFHEKERLAMEQEQDEGKDLAIQQQQAQEKGKQGQEQSNEDLA